MGYKNKPKKKQYPVQHRALYEIQRDIDEAVNNFNKAVRMNDFCKQALFYKQIDRFNKEYHDVQSRSNIDKLRKNQDRNLITWQAKTLAGCLNMIDLAFKLQDMYFAQFAETGFHPRESWVKVQKDLERSMHDFRMYISGMFTGRSMDENYKDFEKLEELFCKYMYTDREMVYYKQYDEKR